MKIISWNVNGLASCKCKGFLKFLAHAKPDFFCCQEIKTQCPLQTLDYFQFWDPAQRKGYSGTLTLARKKPLSVHYGLGIDEIDCEGRVITLEYETLYMINVYVPNSQGSYVKTVFKKKIQGRIDQGQEAAAIRDIHFDIFNAMCQRDFAACEEHYIEMIKRDIEL